MHCKSISSSQVCRITTTRPGHRAWRRATALRSDYLIVVSEINRILKAFPSHASFQGGVQAFEGLIYDGFHSTSSAM